MVPCGLINRYVEQWPFSAIKAGKRVGEVRIKKMEYTKTCEIIQNPQISLSNLCYLPRIICIYIYSWLGKFAQWFPFPKPSQPRHRSFRLQKVPMGLVSSVIPTGWVDDYALLPCYSEMTGGWTEYFFWFISVSEQTSQNWVGRTRHWLYTFTKF